MAGDVDCQMSLGLSPWDVLLWGWSPLSAGERLPRTDDTFLSKAGRKEPGLTQKQVLPLLSKARAMPGTGWELTFVSPGTPDKAASVQALLGGQGEIKSEITCQLRTLIR